MRAQQSLTSCETSSGIGKESSANAAVIIGLHAAYCASVGAFSVGNSPGIFVESGSSLAGRVSSLVVLVVPLGGMAISVDVLFLQLTFSKLAAHAIFAVARSALVKLFLCMMIPHCRFGERGCIVLMVAYC